MLKTENQSIFFKPVQLKAFQESNILKALREKYLTHRSKLENENNNVIMHKKQDSLVNFNMAKNGKIQSPASHSLMVNNKKSKSFVNHLLSDNKVLKDINLNIKPTEKIMKKEEECKNKQNLKGILSNNTQKENYVFRDFLIFDEIRSLKEEVKNLKERDKLHNDEIDKSKEDIINIKIKYEAVIKEYEEKIVNMKNNHENELTILRKSFHHLEENLFKYKRKRMEDQLTINELKKMLVSPKNS